jgi:hypothetical protein
MSQSAGAVRNGLVLRFSVPTSGELRSLATELAVKLAEQLGVPSQEDAPVARALEDLARRIGLSDSDTGQGAADIAFEIHKLDRELRIEARLNGRASEARIPLPA